MAQTIQPGGPRQEPIDDYRVDRDVGQAMRPPTHYILATINGLLLIILAGVSFALFWVVATMIGYL